MNPNYTDIFGRLNYNDKRIRAIAHTVNNLPYKVYTALLTQSGGSSVSTTGSFNAGPGKDVEGFYIGVSYEITANPNNADLSIYGASNNSVGTKFVSIYNGNLSDDNLDVDVIFSFNQGAPVVNVLENTIGNIWFENGGTGRYNVKSDSLFIVNRTFTSITNNIEITDESIFTTNVMINGVGTTNRIQVFTFRYNVDGGWNGAIASDDMLLNTPIEIRVYN